MVNLAFSWPLWNGSEDQILARIRFRAKLSVTHSFFDSAKSIVVLDSFHVDSMFRT